MFSRPRFRAFDGGPTIAGGYARHQLRQAVAPSSGRAHPKMPQLRKHGAHAQRGSLETFISTGTLAPPSESTSEAGESDSDDSLAWESDANDTELEEEECPTASDL